ncbi:MAG: phosphatidate cytidylyltransferase [Gallionellales bacterium 35-53-114]|jgi:phosphatidate cytidylyltransferase|nr:MAG: phosphatidate cytidylyltransferase [Gallionellales bacterium 35-53-114]OYZ65378.1 MAG: phosphatidate cytidylyltransferase [Gallionellales bacterium 24-53-125]OZB08284.1 MAG: phosphatidate cytidylyltransferase [Gallionellales bacterium 39-52-133]HQS58221.1 phosphatidate cytidylyltransferase [Gallionellaceae bacterium]HQS73776.1 phosphatidate cytidylyltransferase [Gallionellaceae bacterium]
MLKQRVITAVILAVAFLFALFVFPSSLWALLVTLVVMQGTWEWARLTQMSRGGAVAYMAVTLILFLAVLMMHFVLHPHLKNQVQISVYVVATAFWLVFVPAWFKYGWNIRKHWLLAMLGWVLLIPTGMAMLGLREISPQPWWLLGVMGLVWVADISAYFTGRLFGKHKLAPRISPGKTWEGVAGAMLGALVYVFWVMSVGEMSQQYVLILFAIVGVALSVIGDLFESAIKRLAGVKDSGTLLPGHGGLLDRIDALTSTLPVAALAMILLKLA